MGTDLGNDGRSERDVWDKVAIHLYTQRTKEKSASFVSPKYLHHLVFWYFMPMSLHQLFPFALRTADLQYLRAASRSRRSLSWSIHGLAEQSRH
jgi:hypothetical protein